MTSLLTAHMHAMRGCTWSLQLTPMEMMKLRMRKALDNQLQKDKTAIAKKNSKETKMAELDRK